MIQNEGMPAYKNPLHKGLLIVQFVVEFPDPKKLTPQRILSLEKCLPPREEIMIPDDAEEAQLEEYKESSQQRNVGRQYSQVYAMEGDDDDEGSGRPQAVQCGTQ